MREDKKADNLLGIIQSYNMASSQSINFQKCHSLIRKYTSLGLKYELLSKFHMHELLPSDLYLGLLVLLGCSRQQALAVVKDKIRSKTQSWK